MKSQYPNPNHPATPSRNIAPPFPILGFRLLASFRISGFGFRVSPAPRRSGFSFAEVMFAVVILGIGFIMIAAIFPVAMQQSQTTTDESTAAAIARQATNTISALPLTINNQIILNDTAQSLTPPVGTPATVPVFPPTVKNYVLGSVAPNNNAPPAIVVPFTGPRWDAIKNSIILPSDQRCAYVPFYRRENGSNVAQIIVIAVTVRNRSTYDLNLDVSMPPTSASIITVAGVPGAAGANTTIYPDTITVPSALEGYYATIPSTLVTLATQPAGRTYRCGRLVTAGAGGNQFEIDPGDGLAEAASPTTGLWGAGTIDDTPGTYTANVYAPSTLQPIAAYASLFTNPASIAGRITLAVDAAHAQGAISANVAPACAAPGAFVIIADDWPYDPKNPTSPSYAIPPNNPTATPPGIVGSLNGHIYRLGQPIPPDPTPATFVAPGTFELDPVFGMRTPQGASPDTIPALNLTNPSGGANPWARVYLVGRGLTTPQSPNTGYSGAAQDVAVYTTYIPAQ